MEETKELGSSKPSYEELEAQIEQMRALNTQLQEIVYKQNMNNLFQRLNYLFKVVGIKDTFSAEFTTKCAMEIEQLLTLDDTEEDNNKE